MPSEVGRAYSCSAPAGRRSGTARRSLAGSGDSVFEVGRRSASSRPTNTRTSGLGAHPRSPSSASSSRRASIGSWKRSGSPRAAYHRRAAASASSSGSPGARCGSTEFARPVNPPGPQHPAADGVGLLGAPAAGRRRLQRELVGRGRRRDPRHGDLGHRHLDQSVPCGHHGASPVEESRSPTTSENSARPSGPRPTMRRTLTRRPTQLGCITSGILGRALLPIRRREDPQ